MDVLVVGAGLAGLTAAHGLSAHGVAVQVLESRSRVGGRLMTLTPESPAGSWFDLGATWHWGDQPRVRDLARAMDITIFPQFDEGSALHEDPGQPPAAVDDGLPPAFRFVGGAQSLCERLAERLPPGSISLNSAITAVTADDPGVTVTTVEGGGTTATQRAKAVLVAVPPRLALQNIDFYPALPDDLVRAMEVTPTWMGDAVKCVAVYETPFWRANGRSGSAFSHAGPLHEVHDGSNEDGSVAALWGLVDDDPELRGMAPDDRVSLVLEQLGRLFGSQAADPTQYFERDWSADPNTNEAETDLTIEPAPYGHPLFATPLLDGRLVWAGAETVAEGGGHMEGAVRSAERAVGHLLERVGRD